MKEIFQILIISVALAADAMSVTFAVGIKAQKHTQQESLKLAVPFGFFQGAMTLIGWALGSVLAGSIANFGTIIGFVILVVIGIKTIREGLSKDEKSKVDNLSVKKIIILSLATSIDALVVGASIALLELNVGFAAICIALTTFVLCYFIYHLSKHFGKYFGKYVEVAGGIILILVGISLLIF